MSEKYGRPGEMDDEGLNPYADSVGPGIYGGRVQRDAAGRVVEGRQYQSHNPRPGPVYAGGGYTPMASAVQAGPAAVAALLDRDPALLEDVAPGGSGRPRSWRPAGPTWARWTRTGTRRCSAWPRTTSRAGADPGFRSARGETATSIARASSATGVLA